MLEDLKILLNIVDDNKDKLLELIIKKSKNIVKNYCNVNEVPVELEDTVTDIAVIVYNRMGTEGLSSESYSGVSNSFESDMPKSIRRNLNRYRSLF